MRNGWRATDTIDGEQALCIRIWRQLLPCQDGTSERPWPTHGIASLALLVQCHVSTAHDVSMHLNLNGEGVRSVAMM